MVSYNASGTKSSFKRLNKRNDSAYVTAIQKRLLEENQKLWVLFTTEATGWEHLDASTIITCHPGAPAWKYQANVQVALEVCTVCLQGHFASGIGTPVDYTLPLKKCSGCGRLALEKDFISSGGYPTLYCRLCRASFMEKKRAEEKVKSEQKHKELANKALVALRKMARDMDQEFKDD